MNAVRSNRTIISQRRSVIVVRSRQRGVRNRALPTSLLRFHPQRSTVGGPKRDRDTGNTSFSAYSFFTTEIYYSPWQLFLYIRINSSNHSIFLRHTRVHSLSRTSISNFPILPTINPLLSPFLNLLIFTQLSL